MGAMRLRPAAKSWAKGQTGHRYGGQTNLATENMPPRAVQSGDTGPHPGLIQNHSHIVHTQRKHQHISTHQHTHTHKHMHTHACTCTCQYIYLGSESGMRMSGLIKPTSTLQLDTFQEEAASFNDWAASL